MEKDAFEAGFQRAIDLANAERHVESVALLGELVRSEQDPRRLGAAYWYLGSLLLHELDDAAGAQSLFAQALAVAPRSERASIGSFHALVGQGRVDEAFDEMRRFLAHRDSSAYRRLLDEIHAEEGDAFLAWHDGPTEAVLLRGGTWWYASMLAWRPEERLRVFGLVPVDEHTVRGLKKLLAVFERDEAETDRVRLREAVQAFLQGASGPVELRLCESLSKPRLESVMVDFEEVASMMGKDVEEILENDPFDILRAKIAGNVDDGGGD